MIELIDASPCIDGRYGHLLSVLGKVLQVQLYGGASPRLTSGGKAEAPKILSKAKTGGW
jgi:hypothetical protein